MRIPVADLGTPTAQNFLIFMQFFAKIGKIICWRPLLREILDTHFITYSSDQSFSQNQVDSRSTAIDLDLFVKNTVDFNFCFRYELSIVPETAFCTIQ